MPAFTPNLNLYKPGGGSTGTITPDEVVDIDRINANMDLIDAAVGDPDNQNRQWYGPAAQIGTLPVSPKDGDTYQESDGSKILWKRLGGVWATNEGGMYLLRPTSITNGTVGTDGTILPTAGQSTLSLDFSSLSRWRTLKIFFYVEPTAADSFYMRFRRAGSNVIPAGSYKHQRLRSNGATVASDYVEDTFSHLGVVAQAYTAGEITLHNFGESATAKTWQVLTYQGDVNPHTAQIAGIANDAAMLAALDGIALYFNGSTFKAGAKNYVKVYGLA